MFGRASAHLLVESADEIGFHLGLDVLGWKRPGLSSIFGLRFRRLGGIRFLLTCAPGRAFGRRSLSGFLGTSQLF